MRTKPIFVFFFVCTLLCVFLTIPFIIHLSLPFQKSVQISKTKEENKLIKYDTIEQYSLLENVSSTQFNLITKMNF